MKIHPPFITIHIHKFLLLISATACLFIVASFATSNDNTATLKFDYTNDQYIGGSLINPYVDGGIADTSESDFYFEDADGNSYKLGKARDTTDVKAGPEKDGWTPHSFDVSKYVTKSGTYHVKWKYVYGWDTGHVKNLRIEVSGKSFFDDKRGAEMGNALDGAGDAADGGEYVDHYVTVSLPSSVTKDTKKGEQKSELVFIVPSSIDLKLEGKFPLGLSVQNKSKKEVAVDNKISVSAPSFVSIDLSKPRLFTNTLSAGQTISTSADNLEESIEQPVLTGKNSGKGEISLKLVYNTDNQAKILEAKIPIAVSGVHVQRDKDATKAFSKNMVFAEKRGGYVFVAPEKDVSYEATVSLWQKIHNDVDLYYQNLIDGLTGMLTPEILSFFDTVEQLNEAKTPQQITEITLRSVAPPVVTTGYDLAGLADALNKQMVQEKAFLKYFGAKEFKLVPLTDKNNKLTSYSKAVVKTYDGKKYAVKIGDITIKKVSD